MVQEGGKKKKNKNKKKNKQGNQDDQQAQQQQHQQQAPLAVPDVEPETTNDFVVVPNPTPNNANKLVNGLVTNKVVTDFNCKETMLKNLAMEAKQYYGYDWSMIQDAETKYQTYLAKKRKVWFLISM